MFAFDIFDKIDFFWSVLGKFLVIVRKKLSTPTFQLFEAFFRLQLLARIITNHQYQKKPLPIVLG